MGVPHIIFTAASRLCAEDLPELTCLMPSRTGQSPWLTSRWRGDACQTYSTFLTPRLVAAGLDHVQIFA